MQVAAGQGALMKAQGWYRDPYGVHQDRYFSDGEPTKLVRDDEDESYDPPPPGQPEGELIEVVPVPPVGAEGLLRADDLAAGPATYDNVQAFYNAMNVETALTAVPSWAYQRPPPTRYRARSPHRSRRKGRASDASDESDN